MRKWAASVGVVVGLVAALTSCASQEPPPTPQELAAKVSADGMYTHLRKLQEIADANDGNRADGTAGYDATVDYVAKFLRDRGFDVTTPEFELLDRIQGGNPTIRVNGREFPVDQASLLITTGPGGLNAVTLRPRKAAGCRTSDYDGTSVRGAIAVVDDTGCSVVDKQNAAVSEGAVGLLVVSTPGPDGSPAGLFTPGYYQDLTVPVGVIDRDANAALLRTTAPVRLVLDSEPVMKKTRNVVAQTRTGDARNVVLAGAHLDSSAASPGVNDDGTGIAALLETAAALGSQPPVTNAVRFVFWASEENGLAGPTKYLQGLSPDELRDIALYLDFDMLGSPNAGYFTYDGDQSAQPNPDIPTRSVPTGSAGIERTLAAYLNSSGVRPADMPLSQFTDYYPFLAAGVPIGGLTAGASHRKSEVQARLWGGRAGVPFDPNYRTERDTVDNINSDALSVLGPAVAYAVATYARSVDGVNGVPPRDQRRSR
ncbi:M28 family peptidase [Mycolicibacterium celeriflavum]|uniref:M28 family peptidase n=1 Tax=Mycolicibacterium celeriflavum TaxID=1249101 RepID=UPI0009F53FDE|nr:M28 family peptidase [Mycolicibacterium celeriflavum]MCV7239222.1 M28 family peptidase [Mycolicibacterium celeriflavum]ORA46935.1 peptidase M28 [Mycolicibacterium celeriflavum]